MVEKDEPFTNGEKLEPSTDIQIPELPSEFQFHEQSQLTFPRQISNCFQTSAVNKRQSDLANRFRSWVRDDPQISKESQAVLKSLENYKFKNARQDSSLATGVTCQANRK